MVLKIKREIKKKYMKILCDNPSELKNALGGEYSVEYSPALDIYTKDNSILRTLKGMYFSSKLDFTDESLLRYIKEVAQPADLPVPVCHTCYNYEDFDKFCKKFIDNALDLKIAYDVETTAAPYLSDKYKLAGFSLASTVAEGCYVILDSLDYENPDKEFILNRLADVIRNHNILVFNVQHEYIATRRCVSVNLQNDCKKIDDAYSMALLLKTESFKADVFKLKLLCNRLLGIDNWATIIDDYIDLAMDIARSERINFENPDTISEELMNKVYAFNELISAYGYNKKDTAKFIRKIQDSYVDWEEQDMMPYSLIPSKIIDKYGCYDSCYLLALFDYFETWVSELNDKLADSLNTPNIDLAYREVVNGQIMSAILTLNGIFISEKRDNEVKNKNKKLADKYYNNLWNITSDSLGKNLLREYAKRKFKDILEKKYILPLVIEQLIPDGFEFIRTTPTLYSFECRKTDISVDEWLEAEGLKPCNKEGTNYKLLQKHLKPYSSLENEDELLESVLDQFLEDSINKNGSLQKEVFKPMSGPDELMDILTKDLAYSHFLSRVVLFEYQNLPEKLKDEKTDAFLEEHLLSDFNTDVDLYSSVADRIMDKTMEYLKKSYSYKLIYESLLDKGLTSFRGEIIAYIYNIYTSTGCSVEEPVYSAFNFICQLRICRKYLHVLSTFIKGASGGYSSQMRIKNDSISNEFMELDSVKVTNDNDEPDYIEGTSNVAFGKWFASTADTGRWKATIHNVPAGAYCKRRFTSRFPGGVILAADMSQMEVRELAMVSHCEKLIETIKDPKIDIHKRTASLAFDVPYDEVSKTQRKQTKEGIFSIVYGRELESLAATLFKGDKASAQRLMDSIFKVYPEVPEYLSDALSDAKKHGYLVTRRGAPIYINPYNEGGGAKGEQAWKRNVQNYAIQGGASYICTNTLVNVQKLIDKYNMNDKIKIICYIHDSIEVDVHPDVLDIAYRIMYKAFNDLATKLYDIPCKGDLVIGVSMGEELDFERIEENHYKVSGNNSDILELIDLLKENYNVEVLNSNIEETINNEDNVSWIFIPRAEMQWYDSITPSEYEIKISK